MRDGLGGHDNRRPDVVFHLELHCGMKILAHPEGAPRPVRVKTDAKIGGYEPAVVALEFVTGCPIDVIDAEMPAPVLAPFRLATALHDKNQFLDILRDALDPLVVVGAKLARGGREQLDDRAERTVVAENGAFVDALVVGRETARIVP